MKITVKAQEDLVVSRFDDQAQTYHSRYGEKTGAGHSFRIREQRVYELFDKPGGTVLDIGCGPGITVHHLVGQRCRFYGVDLSEEMISECRRRFSHLSTARFSVGRIEQIEFPDGCFDAVLCMGVVEYLDDDLPAIREMARVLKPGGTLIVTLPNRASPFRIWRRWVFRPIVRVLRAFFRRGPRKGIVHREYAPAQYGRLLGEYGLDPVEVVYYNVKVIPSPFDEWFPILTARACERLERLAGGPFGWLGTGFIVKAVRQ